MVAPQGSGTACTYPAVRGTPGVRHREKCDSTKYSIFFREGNQTMLKHYLVENRDSVPYEHRYVRKRG